MENGEFDNRSEAAKLNNYQFSIINFQLKEAAEPRLSSWGLVPRASSLKNS